MWVGKQSCSRESKFEAVEQQTDLLKVLKLTMLTFQTKQRRELSKLAMQPIARCTQRRIAAVMLLLHCI